RRRVEHALVDARRMQRMVAEFYREHSAVFHDYAEATADPSTPDDVWELLDRLSGYAALWINVLATEAILGSMLEDRPPPVLSPRAAADPASSRTSQVSEVPYPYGIRRNRPMLFGITRAGDGVGTCRPSRRLRRGASVGAQVDD